MPQDWFAQAEADWFSSMEQQFETENQQQMQKAASIPAVPTLGAPGQTTGVGDPSGYNALIQKDRSIPRVPTTATGAKPAIAPQPKGAGPRGAAKPGGRMGGAGAAKPQTVSEDIFPNVGDFLVDNAPLIAGTVASGISAAASGGASIPIQIGMGMLSAGGGAMMGKGAQNQLRADTTGIPQPPVGTGMIEAAIVDGMLPEATGVLAAGTTRVGKNILSRIGAAGRNRKLMDNISNPHGIKMDNPLRVGKPVQRHIAEAAQSAKDPLNQKYDEFLQGPLGTARRLDYAESGHGQPLITESPGQFTIQEAPEPQIKGDLNSDFTIEEPPTQFTVTEKGPTFAQRHTKRSEALADQRAYKKSGDKPKAARKAGKMAAAEMAEMEKIAQDNGMKMDEYTALNDAYRQVSEKFDNTFQRSIQSKKGVNVIEMLTSPKSWKSQRRPVGERKLDIMQDPPELVKNLRDAVGNDEVWKVVQTAVQKRIVRQASDMHGNIQPRVLARRIRDMVDFGAEELVPNHKELLQFAQILDEHTGGPLSVPRMNASMGVIDRVLKATKMDNAMSTPDVGRIMRQRNTPGFSRKERIAGRTAHAATATTIGAAKKK